MGSLKNLSLQVETAPVQEKAVPAADRPLEAETFAEVWKRYLEKIKEARPSLYSILASSAPEPEADGRVVLHVANQSSQEAMEKDALEVLSYLRAELKNGKVDFCYRIDENRELAAKPYTPNEKFMQMVKNNPELKNFKDTLHLELEF